jgi:hypothetical protein
MSFEKSEDNIDSPLELDDVEVNHSEADSLKNEIGGFHGPEPTRYGDWEKNGRCIDF